MIDVSASGHYVGDCRDLLAQLPEACAQTCVTSPPYWALRDYGTAQWDGGDSSCDHMESKPSRTAASVASSTLVGSKTTVHASHVFRGNCGRCGAVRVDRQIGLEPTPDAYVASLVEVFRGVRRALREDGTLWLNLGDSYAGNQTTIGNNPSSKSTLTTNNGRGPKPGDKYSSEAATSRGPVVRDHGLKNKDLVGIPWLAAFALRADGWYLRQDIIWSKPNPMPESVTDRCTKAHEYLFLLSKSERYLYDSGAIAEPATELAPGNVGATKYARAHAAGQEQHRTAAGLERARRAYETRNRRSVWTVASQPYDGAHFACFPPKLIEPCILAGSRPGDIVLDPFFGSGTTGAVAEKHGRRWIGFDLNPEYATLAKERTAQRSLTLA